MSLTEFVKAIINIEAKFPKKPDYTGCCVAFCLEYLLVPQSYATK
jgi:hypothetical protein